MAKYTNISLPAVLIEQIKTITDHYGYSSTTEFVKDACRRHIEFLSPPDTCSSCDNWRGISEHDNHIGTCTGRTMHGLTHEAQSCSEFSEGDS